MQHVGHFEFGLDRRAICVGDEIAQEVMDLWKDGQEVRGSARHWASVYGWLLDKLESDEQVATAVKLVRYEDLCNDPEAIVGEILEHCELSATNEMEEFADSISAPQYYSPDFTHEEEAIIAEETAQVAQRFGYEAATSNSELAATP